VVIDISDDGSTDEGDYSDIARLQQRTWIAAAPYLVAAVVAWVGAAYADYRSRLSEISYTQSQQIKQGVLHETILQVLAQALLFAGLGLFTVGLLVVVFRQHERWRRDCGRWLGDPPDLEDDPTDAEP
jgi:hypothetical protein